jgi:clan AA aspartic protease (TIGR02281 family)
VGNRVARLSKAAYFLTLVAATLFVGFALSNFLALIGAKAGLADLIAPIGMGAVLFIFLPWREQRPTPPTSKYSNPEQIELALPIEKTDQQSTAGPPRPPPPPPPPPASKTEEGSAAGSPHVEGKPIAIDPSQRIEVSRIGFSLFYQVLGALIAVLLLAPLVYAISHVLLTIKEPQRPELEIAQTVERWGHAIADRYYSFARWTKKQFARQRTGEPTYDDLLSDLQSDENADVRRYAALLARDVCNKPAAHQLILQLNTDLRFSDTRILGANFLSKCVKDYEIAFPTVYALFHSSKFEAALSLLNEYAAQERDSAQFASWQGFLLEKVGRVDEAASEFQRALFFFDDMRKVGRGQFDYAMRALKAAGKFCDAARPLELFVSFDPATRSTIEIESQISSLRKAGNCPIEAQGQEAVVRIEPHGGVFVVDAEINGTSAVLVVDTGASTVHLTNQFSSKAGIPLRSDRTVTSHGVTGSRRDYLTKAETVMVGGIVARDVLVTVASDTSGLGPGIDGLLGQTYLSRMKVTFNAATRTLTMGPRR